MVRVEGSGNNKRVEVTSQSQTNETQQSGKASQLPGALSSDAPSGAEQELHPELSATQGQPVSGNNKAKKGAERTAELKAASQQLTAQQNAAPLSADAVCAKYDRIQTPPLKSGHQVTSDTLSNLKTQRIKAENDIKTAQSEYNNAVTGKNEKVQAEKTKCDEKQKAYYDALDESKDPEVQELKGKIKETETKINKAEEEIKKFDVSISETETSISENDSQLKVVKNRVSSFISQISKLKGKLSKAEDGEKPSIQSQINSANAKKAEAEADEKNLTAKKKSLDEKKKELKANKEKTEKELKELNKEKKDLDDKIKSCKDEKVKTALKEYNDAKANYQNVLTQSKSELKQLESTLKSKRSELERIDKEIAKEEERIILEKKKKEQEEQEQQQAAATSSYSGGYSAGGGSYYSGGGGGGVSVTSVDGSGSYSGDSSVSGTSSTFTETPVGDLSYDKNKKYTAEGLKKAMAGHPNAANLSVEFFQKVLDLANELKCNPCDLLAMMNSESGLKANSYNEHYKAGGLIGFMTPTAQGLGTTVSALINMRPEDQMKYVRECLLKAKKMAFGDMNKELSGGDLYAMNFLPAYAKNDVLTTRGTNFYTHNAVLDYDKDNDIDKKDMETRLGKFYVSSLKQYRDVGEMA